MHYRTSPNGVFSIKIQPKQVKAFGDFNAIKKFFPDAAYVLLSRKNVLRQAISFSIASQTGVWISGQRSNNVIPRYSYEQIDLNLRRILTCNASWRYILTANNCSYIELTYESVKNNIAAAIKNIADFTGVDVSGINMPQLVTRKQSNELNALWEKQYLKDFKGETFTPAGTGLTRFPLLNKLKQLKQAYLFNR